MSDIVDRSDMSPTAIHRIICLEASPESERLRYEIFLGKNSDLSDSEIGEKVQNLKVDSPTYWPTSQETSSSYSDLFLTRVESPLQNISLYSIEYTGEKQYAFQVTHISGWPDSSIPFDTPHYRQAIAEEIIKLAKTTLSDKHLTYIHCRSGFGRAGVFRLALEHAMAQLNEKASKSTGDLVAWYRQTYRYGVQTPEQFHYLHTLCKEIDRKIYETKSGQS